MALAPGTKLGPYEIQSPLGAGGMGEVYRARDTRLDRTVAIKILASNLTDKPDAKVRFDREAKAISSLNHPNICTLYDVGQQDGIDFLVMEFLEGETAADRLLRGPLPLDQVLKVGAEICEGLQKAHRTGVIHRDLKPGNIMLTKSGAKLMDFGLAKEALSPVSSSGSALTAVVTEKPLTEQGVIVGTFQYMAPEQLQGRPADARSDIFAFGAVLYEMITGKRAFSGKTQLSVASAILEKDPEPLSAVRPTSPAALDRIVKGCLTKDPDDRWQTVHDVKLQLRNILETGSQSGETAQFRPARRIWQQAGSLLAAIFFVLLIAAGLRLWNGGAATPAGPLYFRTAVPFSATDLSVSPDGRKIAMVAYSSQTSSNEIWIYEVGSQQPMLIHATQGASFPFWSPDARFVGFFADGKLKKADAGGQQILVLCDAPNGRGGTWGRDGDILFSPDAIGVKGLYRVSAQGGTAIVYTLPDKKRYETSHRWPMFLPDGRHFLYLAANFTGHSESNAIFVGSLDSQEKRFIVNTNANAVYVDPGYLIYKRGNTLVSQPFDTRKFTLTGEPRVISDDVLYSSQIARATYSASHDVLVVQSGMDPSGSQLNWYNRNGKQVGTVASPGNYHNVRLSPDGRRVATDQTDPDGLNIDVWIHEPARGLMTRMTFDPALDYAPIWSPDGKRILFGSSRQSAWRLFVKNSDGSGSETTVLDLGDGGWQVVPFDWSRDGKRVLFRSAAELWYFTLPDRAPKPLFQASWSARNAQFSPDDRWIAYASNESGGWEICVSPFPSVNGKWQVSRTGGQEPRWRADGKELFFVSPEGKMMAAPVSTGAMFEAGSPVELFQTHRRPPASSTDVFSYDVTGDGQKFLIDTEVENPKSTPPSITLHWNAPVEK
jgi:eukaryotic-like serine/threonine-protein kinase